MVKKLMVCIAGIVAVFAASSRAKGDPIKVQPIAWSASSYYSNRVPSNVSDGNPGTEWNSGNYGPSWIMLDLGRPTSVSKIRLMPDLYPYSTTNVNFTVWAGTDPNNLREIYSRLPATLTDSVFYDISGDGINYDHIGNVRYLKIYTQSDPTWVAWREIEVYQGIEYFGFYADSFGGVGTDCAATGTCNFSSETAANGANVNDIAVTSIADLQSRLAVSKQLGTKAVLDLGGWLWDGNGRRSDWLSQWYLVRDAINNGGYQSTVAAFYPHDEPYRSAPGGNYATMKQWLTDICAQIKTDFASIPTAVAISTDELMNWGLDRTYTAMFTWVGFDAYDTWSSGYGFPSSTCASTGATGGMCTLINTLRSWMAYTSVTPSERQRMIAFPSTALTTVSYSDTTPSTQYWMVDTNMNMWLQEVLSDADYAMVMPYLWQSDVPSAKRSAGTRDMPVIKSRAYEMAYGMIPRTTNRVFPVSFSALNSYNPNNTLYPSYPPANAFDLDTSNMWNSACYASGLCLEGSSNWTDTGSYPYVQANFEGLTHITRIELTTDQDIAGTTDHVLWGLTTSGWQQFGWFNQSTSDNQKLVWTGSVDISAFQVKTDVSPTWVAWRDIQFCAPANGTQPCN